MNYEIVESSPQALKVAAGEHKQRKYDFPFDQLGLGQSFKIPQHVVNYGTLRTMVSRANKKLNVQMRVIKHDESEAYEVFRVLPSVGK